MKQFAVWCLNLVILSIPWTNGGYNVVFTTVTEGRLRGITQRSAGGRMYKAYKGVPYAQPPVGALRWSPPQPPSPWDGVRAAVRDPPHCPQYILLSDTYLGDEDCLYLNVYKAPGTTNAPVIVWIHGGAFTAGSARQDHYGPDFFMDLQVILVTVNYRLGALGFLSTGDDILPGNYGLKDQAAALAWIKANARAFGGDPDRITLMGQSSGAASVSMHLLSPHSSGLMTAAIVLSGSAIAPWAVAREPMAVFNRVASLVGCGPPPPENERESFVWRMDDPGLDEGPEEGTEVHHFRVDHVGSSAHDSAYAFSERTDFDEFVAGTVPTQQMTERFVDGKLEDNQDEYEDEDLEMELEEADDGSTKENVGTMEKEAEDNDDEDYEDYDNEEEDDDDEGGNKKKFNWRKVKRKAKRQVKKQVQKMKNKAKKLRKKDQEEIKPKETVGGGHSLTDVARHRGENDDETDDVEMAEDEVENGAVTQRTLHKGRKEAGAYCSSTGDEQYGYPSSVALHQTQHYGLKHWYQVAAEGTAEGDVSEDSGNEEETKEQPEDDCPSCEDEDTTIESVEDVNDSLAGVDEHYTTLHSMAEESEGTEEEEDNEENRAENNLKDEQTTTWRPLRVTPTPSTLQEKLACMMDVPPQFLVETLYYFPWWGVRLPTPFLPVVEKQNSDADPPFLSGDPEQLLRDGRVNDVPLLTGVTSGEGLGLALAVTFDTTLARALRWRFRRVLSHHILFNRWSRADLVKLRHFYLRGGAPGAPCLDELRLSSLTRLFSDASIIAWQTRWARMWMYAAAKPVFFYMFDFQGRAAKVVALGLAEEAKGVDHGDDLPYLFEDSHRPFPEGFRDLRERIAARVWTSIVVNFARTANPTPEKEMRMPVRWRPLGPGCFFRYLLFNDEPKMVDGLPYQDAMELWDYVEENPTKDQTEVGVVSGEELEDEKEEEVARSEQAAARRVRDEAREKERDDAERHRMEEVQRAEELERKQREGEEERLERQQERFREMVKRAQKIAKGRELEYQETRDRVIRDAKRAMIQQRHMEKRMMAEAKTRAEISAMMADERSHKWQMEAAEAARRTFPETSEEEELRSRAELQEAWEAAVEDVQRKEDEEERLLAMQDVSSEGVDDYDDIFTSRTSRAEDESVLEGKEDEYDEVEIMEWPKGATELSEMIPDPEEVKDIVVKTLGTRKHLDESGLIVDKSTAQAALDAAKAALKAAESARDAAHTAEVAQLAAKGEEKDLEKHLEHMTKQAQKTAKHAEDAAEKAHFATGGFFVADEGEIQQNIKTRIKKHLKGVNLRMSKDKKGRGKEKVDEDDDEEDVEDEDSDIRTERK